MPSGASADTGGYPYASYLGPGSHPADYEWTDSKGHPISRYGYYYRNCTDFVAWKLATTNMFGDYRGFGNGGTWGSRAKGRRYTVNMTPKPGSAAWWGPYKSGVSEFGHVAWVKSVSGNSVTVLEYNFSRRGSFDLRKISRTSVSGYIHFKDLKSAKPKPKDADKDGVPDKSDRCPKTKGPKSNNGCPRKKAGGFTVKGTYAPIPGDFNGDGKADILWYGPGDAFDSMWYGTSNPGEFATGV
ncbi:MAG: CHAP domain-containing protein, partial [Thermoleophilia bacterium]|nr:CHAP domain-containing protein [Thermoleophilia bacterium]